MSARACVAAFAVLLPSLAWGQTKASGSCGNGKVDAAMRHTCAPCVPPGPCPCADVREPLEACDGEDFDGKTCQTSGFFSGQLRCAKCVIDTSGCARLPSDLKLQHRTIGDAPAAAWLGFMTNVLGVLSDAKTGWSLTPYNFDFRGPWGATTALPGPAVLVSQAQGWILLSQPDPSTPTIDVLWPTGDGKTQRTHSFQGGRLVAATMAFRGGALVATERDGAHWLYLVGADGLTKGAPYQVPGPVRALTWVHDGYAVAYAREPATLRFLWLSPELQRRHEWAMPAPSHSFAMAAAYPQGLLVVHSSANGTFATNVVLDARQGMTAAAPAKLLPAPARVVAAGYAGSSEGNFAILDQENGQLFAARLYKGGTSVKALLNLRGARALAATTGYQQIYVAWTQGEKLHLTSFSPFLE